MISDTHFCFLAFTLLAFGAAIAFMDRVREASGAQHQIRHSALISRHDVLTRVTSVL